MITTRKYMNVCLGEDFRPWHIMTLRALTDRGMVPLCGYTFMAGDPEPVRHRLIERARWKEVTCQWCKDAYMQCRKASQRRGMK